MCSFGCEVKSLHSRVSISSRVKLTAGAIENFTGARPEARAMYWMDHSQGLDLTMILVKSFNKNGTKNIARDVTR